MSNQSDGGPAFPVMDEYKTHGQHYGVSVREYFAAKAMQAIISKMDGGTYNYTPADQVAEDAYAFADAMLKECKK